MGELALAVVLAAAILAASMLSVELGFAVALIELGLGVFVGNVFDVSIPDWLSFVGSFAGVVLTFLAGAEVDVPQFRREWKASRQPRKDLPRSDQIKVCGVPAGCDQGRFRDRVSLKIRLTSGSASVHRPPLSERPEARLGRDHGPARC